MAYGALLVVRVRSVEILIAQLLGAVVGVLLLSFLIVLPFRLFAKGKTTFERLRLAAPLGTVGAILISHLSTADSPHRDQEWPMMVFCYAVAGVIWFVVALIASPKHGKEVGLIYGTRMDGFGRTRVALIGGSVAFMLVVMGLDVIDAHMWNLETRDEYLYECLQDYASGAPFDREPATYCNDTYDKRQVNSARRREEGISWFVGSLGLGVLAWFATGLAGWIFRGFAEKPTPQPR